MRFRYLTILIAAGTLTGAQEAPLRQSKEASLAASGRCSALAGRALPGKVKITAATFVPASTADGPAGLPAHCRVEGMINERIGFAGKPYGIGFALALPDNWSGRFLLQGGGGLNGSVAAPLGATAAGDMPALARGFAVISHDSGHKGEVFQADFRADQRANLDFAESSVRVVTEVGKVLVERYYGRPIGHSYMAGCSTGGRESMLASQRYPELFDGIVVGAPAMRTGNSNLAIAWSAVQFNRAAPRDASGKPLVERTFSPADRSLILKGMLAQCDRLDGLDDGMIMNVKACRFDPARLQCSKGKGKTDACLSAAQVTAMHAAFAGPKDKAGYPIYVPMPYDTGVVVATGGLPGYLPTGRPGPFGPASRALTIDVDARIQAIRADAGQRLTDTNIWTNLNSFTGHGGKILFYHGVSDPWFSAFDTLDYWQRAAEENGPAWADASRFYMVPGMGHCGGDTAFDKFDLLGAVVDWVETGKAPAAVLSKRTGSEPATRPMCPWPTYAHYTGGDPRKAESFSCRAATD